MSRIDLNVPFAEKDAAKALGARWDPRRRTWYVPNAAVLRISPGLARWMPQDAPAPVPGSLAAPVAVPDPRPPRDGRVSVSQLAQLERCEQQQVFDKAFGRLRSEAYRAKGRAGRAEHARYERAVAGGAKPRATPCFVATATFGPDSFETWRLRRWRNERLRRRPWGRAVIRAYERLSPPLARWIGTRPVAAGATRVLLRAVIGWLR